MNSYDLSRVFWDYSFSNPDKVNPKHSAVYFFAIEHCNRLGWKDKFGFPSQMVMEAVGIKNWKSYSNTLNDLVKWGFIKMIQVSKNQYSSNIISLCVTIKNDKAQPEALDKALSKHSTKQSQSTVSIDKQLNKEQETSNKGTKRFVRPTLDNLLEFFKNKGLDKVRSMDKASAFLNHYDSNGWKIGKSPMKNWQAAASGVWMKDENKQGDPHHNTVQDGDYGVL